MSGQDRGGASDGKGRGASGRRSGPSPRSGQSRRGGGAQPRGGKGKEGRDRRGGEGRGGGASGEAGGAKRGGRPRRAPAVRKPWIPEDAPRLTGPAWKDVQRAAPPGTAPEVARAITTASEVLDEEPDRARALLDWAKSVAPRSAAVREAIGVAAYRSGDFATAASELSHYRRMSGREDQNHLLADSLRATGRGDRVRELIEAMEGRAQPQRQVEGWIVYAGSLADRGDDLRALAVLERLDLEPDRIEPHHLRLWYLAADLCERLGDDDRAQDYLHAIAAFDAEFLDVAERLRLDDEALEQPTAEEVAEPPAAPPADPGASSD